MLAEHGWAISPRRQAHFIERLLAKAMTTGKRPGWLDSFLGKARLPPKVPDGTRVYAVGDIHGRLDLLERLLCQIEAHAAEVPRRNTLIFLGDYVDRGPRSKDVIDRLMALRLPDWEIVFLRGNHEQMVLDFVDDAGLYRVWRSFGSADTLLSYGVKPPSFDNDDALADARAEFVRKCPVQHSEFLRGLKYRHMAGDYMFVPAGVRPGVAIDRQSPEDLMWIRDEFLLSDNRLEKVVVHGHTPTERPVRRSNRIGIDTGAYATDCLTAVILDGEQCTFVSTTDTGRAR